LSVAGRRCGGGREADHLEAGSHFTGRDELFDRGADFGGAFGIDALEVFHALAVAEAGEEVLLRDRAVDRQLVLAAEADEARKSTSAVRSVGARIEQGGT